MNKPKLLLIHPAPDIDRFGSRRRRGSSVPKLNLPLLASYADDFFNVRIIDETVEDIDFDIKVDLARMATQNPPLMATSKSPT